MRKFFAFFGMAIFIAALLSISACGSGKSSEDENPEPIPVRPSFQYKIGNAVGHTSDGTEFTLLSVDFPYYTVQYADSQLPVRMRVHDQDLQYMFITVKDCNGDGADDFVSYAVARNAPSAPGTTALLYGETMVPVLNPYDPNGNALRVNMQVRYALSKPINTSGEPVYSVTRVSSDMLDYIISQGEVVAIKPQNANDPSGDVLVVTRRLSTRGDLLDGTFLTSLDDLYSISELAASCREEVFAGIMNYLQELLSQSDAPAFFQYKFGNDVGRSGNGTELKLLSAEAPYINIRHGNEQQDRKIQLPYADLQYMFVTMQDCNRDGIDDFVYSALTGSAAPYTSEMGFILGTDWRLGVSMNDIYATPEDALFCRDAAFLGMVGFLSELLNGA